MDSVRSFLKRISNSMPHLSRWGVNPHALGVHAPAFRRGSLRHLLAATPVPLAVALDPAQQRPGESSLPYLFVVYLVTWLAFFAYAFYMTRKQQALHRDLDALRKLLDDKERQGRQGGQAPGRPS